MCFWFFIPYCDDPLESFHSAQRGMARKHAYSSVRLQKAPFAFDSLFRILMTSSNPFTAHDANTPPAHLSFSFWSHHGCAHGAKTPTVFAWGMFHDGNCRTTNNKTMSQKNPLVASRHCVLCCLLRRNSNSRGVPTFSKPGATITCTRCHKPARTALAWVGASMYLGF